MQQETGADISVDDDGMVGTVTIARSTVAQWPRPSAIQLILNP